MKKILTAAFLFLGLTAFSQNYDYTFQVEEVQTLADAAEVSEVVRSLFNEEREVEPNNPTFNEETHVFSITSEVSIDQEELRERLEEHGMVLISFRKEVSGTVKPKQPTMKNQDPKVKSH